MTQQWCVALTEPGVHVSMISFDFLNARCVNISPCGGGKSYANFKEDVT
jgi:hypothetical protein